VRLTSILKFFFFSKFFEEGWCTDIGIVRKIARKFFEQQSVEKGICLTTTPWFLE
jgi:hypothetical protein